MKKRFFGLALIGVLITLLAGGCTGETPGQSGVSSGTTGTLEIRVTDAPPGYEITAVLITVGSVEVHKAVAEQNQDREREQQQIHQSDSSPVQEQDRDREQDQQGSSGNPNRANKGKDKDKEKSDRDKGSPPIIPNTPTALPSESESDAAIETEGTTAGWIPIPIRPGSETFDLVKLQGVEQVLAVSELEPGTYTQIRMAVEAIEVRYADSSGTHSAPAELPSGKLKFVRPFTIEAGKVTALTFDFIASKSVVFTGSDRVIFKPVIKLTVSAPVTPPLRITTGSLPGGTEGTAYQTTLQARGGTLPYTWSIVSGALPTGLTINPVEGIISGTPAASGTWAFAVRVSDSSVPVRSATRGFTLPITAPETPEEGS